MNFTQFIQLSVRKYLGVPHVMSTKTLHKAWDAFMVKSYTHAVEIETWPSEYASQFDQLPTGHKRAYKILCALVSKELNDSKNKVKIKESVRHLSSLNTAIHLEIELYLSSSITHYINSEPSYTHGSYYKGLSKLYDIAKYNLNDEGYIKRTILEILNFITYDDNFHERFETKFHPNEFLNLLTVTELPDHPENIVRSTASILENVTGIHSYDTTPILNKILLSRLNIPRNTFHGNEFIVNKDDIFKLTMVCHLLTMASHTASENLYSLIFHNALSVLDETMDSNHTIAPLNKLNSKMKMLFLNLNVFIYEGIFYSDLELTFKFTNKEPSSFTEVYSALKDILTEDESYAFGNITNNQINEVFLGHVLDILKKSTKLPTTFGRCKESLPHE